jgi:hypothetical protein
MNWVDAVLLGAAVLGLFLGGILVMRHPSIWLAIGSAIFTAMIPKLKEYIAKRNSPEVEAKMHQATRRAHEWDNFNKRPKDK